MDAPIASTSEPGTPAAEPSTPAAERSCPTAERFCPAAERLPAGALCYECRYDLVGRAPGEPCPECGLDVAASWPVEDLRACHRVYVEHVRTELGALQDAAILLGLGMACGGFVLWQVGLPERVGPGALVAGVVAIAAILLVGLGMGGSSKLLRLFRKHARSDVALGAPQRQGMRSSSRAIDVGLFVAIAAAIAASAVGTALAMGLLTVVVVLLLAGVGTMYVQGLTYAALALKRAGVATRRAMIEEAPGLLPFAAVFLLPLAAMGVMPWAWVVAWAMLGVALGAGGLALRCGRARRVLKGLAAQAA